MYAIVKNNGKQYRVSEGEEILVDRLSEEVGKKIEFTDILLVGGTTPKLKADLKKGKVTATVLGHIKAPKVIVFKFKPKKNYKKKAGHRQEYTRLMIDSILLGEKAATKKAAPKAAKAEKKPARKPAVKAAAKTPKTEKKAVAKTTSKAEPKVKKTTAKKTVKPAATTSKSAAKKPVTKKAESKSKKKES